MSMKIDRWSPILSSKRIHPPLTIFCKDADTNIQSMGQLPVNDVAGNF